ncbi:MAG: hypothetical protein U0805_01270 [Pirellulales bacterium]
MLRSSFLIAALAVTLLATANGCQSCSSCHDYDCPVKGCQCGYPSPSGCNGGCSGGGCNTGGCSSCGCNGSGASAMPESSYYMQPGESSQPSSAEVEAAMPESASRGSQVRHW